jgi:hypothetical protein
MDELSAVSPKKVVRTWIRGPIIYVFQDLSVLLGRRLDVNRPRRRATGIDGKNNAFDGAVTYSFERK